MSYGHSDRRYGLRYAELEREAEIEVVLRRCGARAVIDAAVRFARERGERAVEVVDPAIAAAHAAAARAQLEAATAEVAQLRARVAELEGTVAQLTRASTEAGEP